MGDKVFYMPTKPYTLIDAVNRRAAATGGSVRYAQASAGADYNGNDLSLTWNDYRGYYVVQYYFGRRPDERSWVHAVVLHTTAGIPGGKTGGGQRVVASWTHDKDRPGGAHLVVDQDGTSYCCTDLERVVICRSSSFEVALEAAKQAYAREGRGASLKVVPRDVDSHLAEGDPDLRPGREPTGQELYAKFPDPAWKYGALSEALFFDTHFGTSLVQSLIKAGSEDDWRKVLEDFKHPRRRATGV
jgi:hypothetical protein